jgi:hypothetical protein
MKSISAKHAPQSSPWFPIRVLQTMQTGGNSKSASEPSVVARKPGRFCMTLAGMAVGLPVSLIAMKP